MENTKREQAIIDIIDEKGFMSVNELSKALYTSQSSIRRDLARLEEKKILKRTHGGAILAKNTKELSPFYTRKATHIEQKKTAAEKAAYLLADSISVMLDGSSTALQILPHIQAHKSIRVFTNNIYTYKVAVDMGIEAYCLGGAPSTDSEILSGSITEDAVSKLYVDILFFSSKCVNENGDITDPIDSENRLRKIMMKHAKIKVFLYDSSKIGNTALFKLCNISDVDYSFSELSSPQPCRNKNAEA